MMNDDFFSTVTRPLSSKTHNKKEETYLRSFLRDALETPILTRSVKVAVVVGTILTAINNGDALVRGEFSHDMIWKIPATYCVPFCVSIYAGVQTNRERRGANEN